MENLLARHRNVTILVAVLFVEVVGLAVQVKRTTDTDSTRLIRLWTISAVSPLEKGFVATQDGIRNVWHNYFYLRGVRAQNRKLQDEIEQLRLQQVRLAEDAGQARRLQRLLGFKEQFIAKTLPAQVIGSSGSDMSRVVYIDKGANDGIQQDMPVITADGVVGKILRVFPGSSQVLLINDSSSGVGAILEKSRLQGVIRGTPDGELVLEKMMSDERVEPGDQLLTSGGDQIFPKGLPIGTVKSVSPGRDVFLNIRVKPAAQLSRLEEVLVITQVVERQPTQEEAQGAMRAADILAERLPSVPENTGLPATGMPLPMGVKPPKPTAPKAALQVKPGAAGSAPAFTAKGTDKQLAAGTAKPGELKPKTAKPGLKPETAAKAGSVAVTAGAGAKKTPPAKLAAGPAGAAKSAKPALARKSGASNRGASDGAKAATTVVPAQNKPATAKPTTPPAETPQP